MIEITMVISALGIIPTTLVKGPKRFRNQKTTRDHADYSIIKFGQNTKSPGKHEETFCHSNSSENQSANAGIKNYHNNKFRCMDII